MNSTDLRRLLALTITAAIAAGLLAWLVGETKPMWAVPASRPQMTMGTLGMIPTTATIQAAEVATAARLHGVFGAFLGLAMGVAGGLASRSPRRAMHAGLLGMACAAAVGIAAPYAVIPLFNRFRDSFPEELVGSILMHGLIWTSLGVTAAFALALGQGGGTGRLGRVLWGGLLGALVGTVIFDVSGAVFGANDHTGEPVSTTSASRLAARLVISVSVAIAASLGSRKGRPWEIHAETPSSIDQPLRANHPNTDPAGKAPITPRG
jgi:hypothetical protein